MKTSVIIMGIRGRMGATLAQLVQDHPTLSLAGGVEAANKLASCAGTCACPVVSDVAELFAAHPQAIIIDFTSPESSLITARKAAAHSISHVIGTTGLDDAQKAELAELAKKTRIFWAPNMSIGINALMRILPQLTRALGEHYDAEIMEIHHNRKKDAPSGTALLLADGLAKAKEWSLAETACYHREGIVGERPQKEIGMQTLRGGDVVGVHTVYFFGPGERIELTHQAHSRETFAQGALRAAQWLPKQVAGQLYGMQDLLKME